MSRNMIINFNNKNYIAKYNNQTGYWEVNLNAPEIGGIYTADIQYTDLIGKTYTDSQDIQVLAKEKIKIDTNNVLAWIFDNRDFALKDIVELSDYEINIDEETNTNSTIKILKKTSALSGDIVSIKKNNEVIYWGTIEEITNENGKTVYTYSLKYITNIFDQEVILNKNMESTNLEEGIYRFKSALGINKVVDVLNGSVENNTNIQLYESNDTDAQKWNLVKTTDGYCNFISEVSGKAMDIANGTMQNDTNVQQYELNGSDAQKWSLEYLDNGYFRIKAKNGNFYLTVDNSNVENGTNIKIYESLSGDDAKRQQFVIEKLVENELWKTGIEDFIADTIKENFVDNEDTFLNKNFLDIRVLTHTKIKTTVSNVTNNIYNLHTYMTNCTQLYNINYNFYFENKKLVVEIENKELKKQLIDTRAQAISNYTEVFETEIVSKVKVITDTKSYELFLLNDRTTTTDSKDKNRAAGKTVTVYTQNFEDAEQVALDNIQANRYNHMITFSMLERFIAVGTPIAIKTKDSIVLDSYISAVKITKSKFVEYTCGNIRINFIDKLLKERKK